MYGSLFPDFQGFTLPLGSLVTAAAFTLASAFNTVRLRIRTNATKQHPAARIH
jgi:hypothetical protein